jgi:hypothetical protein
LVVQLWFAVHTPQFPLPSQTMLVPQGVPPVLLLPSTHTMLPVEQELVPFRHVVGLPVQLPPAVQATHVPEPLQTMLVPQGVPPVLLVPSTQVMLPLAQAVVPFLHVLFGLVVQEAPAVQATQTPEPLQTMFVPQLTPGPLLVPSTQVMLPLVQEVMPFLHAVGLVEQLLPLVHATQTPEPLQTMFVPQLTPGDLLVVSSTQVDAPVRHEVTPFLQVFGLVPQLIPAVHETHVPEPLQTMLVPQFAPAVFADPFTHVDDPVEQDAMPL